MSVHSRKPQRKILTTWKPYTILPIAINAIVHTHLNLPKFSSRRRLRPTPQHLTKCPIPFINKSIRELRDLIRRRRLTCPHSRLRCLVARVVREKLAV